MSKENKFLSDLVIYNKYANYDPNKGRRQNWEELVTVVKDMHIRRYPSISEDIESAFKYVYEKKVMMSMRSAQYGGLPIELNPCRIYNCSYSPVDHPFMFAESFFELLSGTGVGFSVRQRHIRKLPPIVLPQGQRRFLIGDSIEGFADSIRQLVFAYMKGKERPIFDYRDVRPKGSIIKKSGGKAAGFEKLKVAHDNIEAVLRQAVGRRLTELECHDILCYMADCVLAGGRRDSAMISLFDISCTDMVTCKSNFKISNVNIVSEYIEDGALVCAISYDFVEGQDMNTNTYGRPRIADISLKYGSWDLDNAKNGILPWYYVHPQRARANNSVALRRGMVKKDQFMDLFRITKDFGEPGFLWTNDDDAGVNPCCEIGLNPNQFCNLTSVVVYDVDSQEELNKRVAAASLIGTLQAGYTDFHYLRAAWKETTEKESLLGVSMTGIASGKVLSLDLKEAARMVVKTNEHYANIIGISPAARTTTIKPEGTGTLAMGVMGSGIHAVHGKYMIRNVRINKSEPLYAYLCKMMPDFVESDNQDPDYKAVVSIPMKAVDGVITRDEPTIDLLERVKRYNIDWVREGHVSGVNTHNVSATISVRDGEWDMVADWMWENRDYYSGLSLLPYSGGNYKQAPFIEIDESEYEKLSSMFPSGIDFNDIAEDSADINHASDNIACAGGACSLE